MSARFVALLALVLPLSTNAPTASAATAPDYLREVKPILDRHCISCHGRLKQKGELRLDAGILIHKGGKHGAVLVPGKSRESEFIRRVSAPDEKERMPQDGKPLAPEEIALLANWIDAGAPVPADEKPPSSPAEHWSFQPVKRPAVPLVKDRTWSRNPIDQFLLARLEGHGWRPAPDAAPEALLRRLFLDLNGLPPAVEEQEKFGQASPDQFDALVDALLAQPQYGERWARHWLDLARYADSNGYERDAAKPFVWRYRDYVIRSFNADKPFDRFILEQLAGDELPDVTKETLFATGFQRLGHWDDEPADPDADRFDQLDDMVTTTSEVFLGLTIGCARCHDHKFEPLSTRDYYSMVAVFNPLKRPQEGRSELTVAAGSPADLAAVAARDRAIERLKQESAAARESFRQEFLKSGQSKLSGDAVSAFLAAPEKRDEKQKKLVADATKQLEEETNRACPADLRARLTGVENAITGLRQATPDLPQGYFLRELSAKPPVTHVLLRGNPKRLGDEVGPAVPAIVARPPAQFPAPASATTTTQRRLGMAQWLASPENPLTARVIVNRVWQQHFGVGLVRTPSDFGLMGEPPTHPELLDWLADWFTHDAQWSLKKLHRLMLTSRAWRMSRTPNPAYADADPDNRLWSFLPYHRLEVEAIRDSILAVSGRLNFTMFGPPMFPAIPDQAIEANTDKQAIWKVSERKETTRRSIYIFIKRGLIVPMLEVLDLSDTVHSCSRRQVTTVAPQALTLFNGDFVNEQAGHFAARLRGEAGPDALRQIELGYRLVLGRPPRSSERQAMVAFLQRETANAQAAAGTAATAAPAAADRALTQLCRVLLNLNEFAYPD